MQLIIHWLLDTSKHDEKNIFLANLLFSLIEWRNMINWSDLRAIHLDYRKTRVIFLECFTLINQVSPLTEKIKFINITLNKSQLHWISIRRALSFFFCFLQSFKVFIIFFSHESCQSANSREGEKEKLLTLFEIFFSWHIRCSVEALFVGTIWGS
jgi:hypothetical protein